MNIEEEDAFVEATSTHVPKPFPSPTQVNRTCLDLRSTWVLLGKYLGVGMQNFAALVIR